MCNIQLRDQIEPEEVITECTEDNRVCKNHKIDPCGSIYKYGCSREYGHSGPHIACGITTHNIQIWE
jgi:hypothetical protein